MTRSDWIALMAAVAAILALIPAYGSYIKRDKTVSTKTVTAKRENGSNSLFLGILFASTAFGALVIELVYYQSAARDAKVNIDLHTMPLVWQVGFYALFVVPGVFLLIAIIHILKGIIRD